MFAKVVFFCAALAAVSASGLIAAPLVNTGVSSRAQTQDVIGKVGIAAAPIAVAAPAIAAPLALAGHAAIGGVIGYGAPLAAAAPLAYGGVLGHGAAVGLGYGSGISGAGIGKLI
ncbi:hypothetical protein NPIL_570141 [Nephila pilipes]|uniref:Uncharacterized protein n=1 Tax=Nephila pilipes TaxID=299642 RepID=A0A8X6TQ88_NEPPI|nr:hypothetical protein NPIL_570141 [Nephila pilipes]